MKKTAKPKLAMKKAVAKPAMKGPSKASNLKSYKFMPNKEYVAKKSAPAKAPVKSASKPAPKVAAKPMKRLTLPEVKVTATRIKKAAPADTLATKQASKPKLRPIQKQAPDTIPYQAKLFMGRNIPKSKVDSIEKADKIKFKNLADSSQRKSVVSAKYDEGDSEYIRKSLKLPTIAQDIAMAGGKGIPGTQRYTGYAGIKPGKFDPKLEVRNRVADYMNYTDTAKKISTKKLNELTKGIEDAKALAKKPGAKNPNPSYIMERKK
jgi:hypothetical protein